MVNDHSARDIDTLNDLISITLDSADGYEHAAATASDIGLKQLFTHRALERRRVVHNLQDLVRKLGAKAEDDGSILARAHRYFMDLRKSVAGDDNKAVIDDIERGEDQIKARYEKALRREDLSGEARRIVERAYVSVKSGHDQTSSMKHAAA